jgi:hypothetical protein
MGNSTLRYSGWHIPIEHWDEFPCWEFAFDEEGDEGQDETTTRPCAEQQITESTNIVAGYAIIGTGERFPAIIGLRNATTVDHVMIYLERKIGGQVVEFGWTKKILLESGWKPVWTSEKFEEALLPIKVVSLATSKQTGVPLSIVIDGVTQHTGYPRGA